MASWGWVAGAVLLAAAAGRMHGANAATNAASGPDAANEAGGGQTHAQIRAADEHLAGKLNALLAGDDALEGSNIQVESHERVVILRGTVPSEAARRRALDTARGVKEAIEVQDRLSIVSKP